MMRFALLLLLATAAVGDEVVDTAHVELDESESLDSFEYVATASCLTEKTPTEAANKAAKVAEDAAKIAKTKALAYSIKTAANAKVAAKAIYDAAKGRADIIKTMADENAGIIFKAAEADAKAKAAALKSRELQRISDERKAAEMKTIEATKHAFDVVAETHRHKMQKIMDEEMAKERGTAEVAHFNKAKSVATALSTTKASFSQKNLAHKAAMEVAFNQYVVGKKLKEDEAASLEAALKQKAVDQKNATDAEIAARYTRHMNAAQAEFTALTATANATKQDAEARADAESKEAEMNAWVTTMGEEVTAASWCDRNNFDITAAGEKKANALAAAKKKKEEEAAAKAAKAALASGAAAPVLELAEEEPTAQMEKEEADDAEAEQDDKASSSDDLMD